MVGLIIQTHAFWGDEVSRQNRKQGQLDLQK